MELLRPSSADEATAALGNGSVALAGGTELVPLLRDGLVRAETLVDVTRAVPRGVDGTTIGAGTTLADFADRSLGIGYPGGSLLLLACVLLSLFAWHRMLGTVDVNSITGPREETFYWVTITFSQTLGTALGDWIADAGLGYSGGALVFGAGLAILAIFYFTTRMNRVALFWAAFIMTRPLGATVGDFLDKPIAKGGLEWSRPLASAVLAVVIVALILLLPQRPGRHPEAGPS